MNEASKTRSLRAPDFVLQYLSGRVIDIGCGNDLVVPHAEPFDRRHGDASQILSYRPPASFDCVHSSHCLEHMPDVPAALRQWWDLVRPGGCMIIVVPHEDLYEQGVWPSLFNPDHKATFRLGSSASWSPVSYDLAALATQLPGAVSYTHLEKVPVLLLPVSGVPAFRHRERKWDAGGKSLSLFQAMMPVTVFNLLGLPGLTIPFTCDGLPVGIQLAGRPYEEELLLEVAMRLEEARGPLTALAV